MADSSHLRRQRLRIVVSPAASLAILTRVGVRDRMLVVTIRSSATKQPTLVVTTAIESCD